MRGETPYWLYTLQRNVDCRLQTPVWRFTAQWHELVSRSLLGTPAIDHPLVIGCWRAEGDLHQALHPLMAPAGDAQSPTSLHIPGSIADSITPPLAHERAMADVADTTVF